VAAKDAGVTSFVYAASSSTYGDHPALPKVEERIGKPLSAKLHRPVDGKLKSITLTRMVTAKHYASLLFDTEQAAPAPLKDIDAAKVVGLDMGLSHLAIDSNGCKIANPRFLKRAQQNLKRKQQALSRCQKGSRRRAKARLLVAKAHEHLANARHDVQHKLSFPDGVELDFPSNMQGTCKELHENPRDRQRRLYRFSHRQAPAGARRQRGWL
jgi:hypothetical protein